MREVIVPTRALSLWVETSLGCSGRVSPRLHCAQSPAVRITQKLVYPCLHRISDGGFALDDSKG